MNWKQLGQKLVSFGAPVVGGLLAGPAGAAVGKTLASAVGQGETATPGMVLTAVSQMSAGDIGRLDRDVSYEFHQRNLEHDEFMAAEWGKNYRAELHSKDPFNSRWRAFIGWCVGTETLLLTLLVMVMGFRGDAGGAAEILSAVSPIIGIQLGVVSYIAKKRSDDKHLSVGSPPPSALGGLLGKLVK